MSGVTNSSTCAVEGCERVTWARGWCDRHYQRWRAHGDPTGGRAGYNIHPPDECTVEGCGRPHDARGFCQMHYKRWRKNGDPNVVQRVATGTWRDATCEVEDCPRPVLSRGYCVVHYSRVRTHGDPSVVLPGVRPLVENPTYNTVHARLRGLKARQCSTPGCERTNTEWALIHGRGCMTDPEGRVYSNRGEDYFELCAKCHRRYDSVSRHLLAS